MKTSHIYLFVLSMVFQSCGPVMYSNVGQNTPLFKEKGEFTGNAGFAYSGPSEDAGGVGLQAAYAVSDHWAVISSFYSMGDSDPEGWRGRGSYFEIGGGYFGYNNNKRLVYELLGGVGFGSIKNNSNTENRFVDLSFTKPFIQPSIGYSVEHFEIAFTPRIGAASFGSISYNLNPEHKESLDQWINDYDGNFFLEPGITLRGGMKNVKLHLQYVFSTFGDEAYSNTGFFSTGLQFLISEKRYLSAPSGQ
mgnify:CR=1 FL=1